MWRLYGGIVVTTLGIIGLKVWWDSFLILLKGTVPLIFILCGLVGIMLGILISSIKD